MNNLNLTFSNKNIMKDMFMSILNYPNMNLLTFLLLEKGFVEIDVKDTVTRYTNDVIASSAFGIEVNSLKDKENEFYLLGKSASDFSGIMMLKFIGFLLFPKLMKVSKVFF